MHCVCMCVVVVVVVELHVNVNSIKNLMFIGPCIIVIVEEWKINLMSLAILFHFLCAQHVSDINISVIRSLRLCCWITTSVVLFPVRCVLEIWCGWFWVVLVLQAEAHKKWNKIASGIKLVFRSSTSIRNIGCCTTMVLWRVLVVGNNKTSAGLRVNCLKFLSDFDLDTFT